MLPETIVRHPLVVHQVIVDVDAQCRSKLLEVIDQTLGLRLIELIVFEEDHLVAVDHPVYRVFGSQTVGQRVVKM